MVTFRKKRVYAHCTATAKSVITLSASLGIVARLINNGDKRYIEVGTDDGNNDTVSSRYVDDGIWSARGAS